MIYSELQHCTEQVHVVGTYFAVIHIEVGNSMTDSQIPASRKVIMVVDDNRDTVTLVKIILEENGYGVQTAYNGLEVFSRLEEQKSDLIILDIMMPRMDGLEVLERLKGTAETSSIPVILLTAKVQQEDMLRGYKLGADYYIPKPFTSAHLINVTNFLLSKDKNTQTKSKGASKAANMAREIRLRAERKARSPRSHGWQLESKVPKDKFEA